MQQSAENRWSTARSNDLYHVDRWGKGFFSIQPNGNLSVRPERGQMAAAELTQIVEHASEQGFDAPLWIRFPQIARSRLDDIRAAFASAIDDFDFPKSYTCIYPIKVNPRRSVIEALINHEHDADSSTGGFGLEAGSKAELLAILPMAQPGMPILCNGFKDDPYIELALRARKLGLNVFVIIEKPSEFALTAEVANRLGIPPQLGVRVKLAARGSGHWEATGGYKSKFGLTTTELLAGVEQLRQRNLLDTLKLLHFHLGSQIPNIRRLKSAVIESTRIYGDLIKRGVGLETIDVGGGLGVDYSGMQNNSKSSMNYSLQEYANDVVYYIRSVCEQAAVPCPNIYSESGRALVAHQSVLAMPVFGSTSRQPESWVQDWRQMPFNDSVQPLVDLRHALDDLNEVTVLESYHDAQSSLETAINLFNSGYLSLQDRAMAESLYRAVCRKASEVMLNLEFVPHELESLRVQLADIYYANFSLFRSLPDHWAIGQLFPVMPLHRLDERPSQKAILSDITCDSDGRLDRFIGEKSENATLSLHPIDGRPYYVGVFLAGAYQEILGANHNLLGETHMADVWVNEDGTFKLELSSGPSLGDVLSDVGHRPIDPVEGVSQLIGSAIDEERLSVADQDEYLQFFARIEKSYGYLAAQPQSAADSRKPPFHFNLDDVKGANRDASSESTEEPQPSA